MELGGDLDAYAALRIGGHLSLIITQKLKAINSTWVSEPRIALCSMNFGFNLYYSYTSYKLDREIYLGAGREYYMREGCLELYVGLPIESFIKPFLPVF